ncbi:tyrosine-type recombinase/integrase [Pseudodesulfovibrio sediminis]|uniref:Integrase n=1 Tax=Pseudodesulfovibrio sediminis TaxID=2810563 RepID=A0ABM7P3E0_9BACT|nr:tyrosine-type recombinase/integrase [Pseudodesulfovibrio sediminis]BCS87346.1 integrase [Pseudodesulfovibrio sediminis]
MLATNPMKGCRPLNGFEVVAIKEAFCRSENYRDICLFVLGVSCGFRVSEMLSLRVQDVHSGGKVLEWLTILQTKTDDTRTVMLGDDDKIAIDAQVTALRLAGYYSPGTMLFRSREGRNKPISRTRAWQILHDTARALGMDGKIGTHSMRKTFANNTFEAVLEDAAKHGTKADALLETARAGGWKSVDSCQRYLSFRMEPQLRAKQANTGQFGVLPHPKGARA